jgi:hypothetical protein
MSYFFANRVAEQPQHGAIILDIGNNITDISVIEGKNNELRYLGSVKYAKRHIFLDSLLAYPKYLKHLGIVQDKLVSVQRDQNISETPNWVYTQLDAKIKGMNDLMQGLSLITQDIQPIIHQMAVGIAGLLFYVGSIIQHLRANDTYTATDELPQIYIGGNGAKVFHWLNNGEYHKGCAYDGLFDAAFRHRPRTVLPAQPQLSLFPTPLSAELGLKPEVAYGLVMNRDHLTLADVSRGYWFAPVAGEAFTLTAPYADEYPAHALLSSEQIQYLKNDALQGQELTTFIDIVNSYASELDLPRIRATNIVHEIIGDLQQHMNEIQQKVSSDKNHIKTQHDEGALFIHEIKLLLNRLPMI